MGGLPRGTTAWTYVRPSTSWILSSEGEKKTGGVDAPPASVPPESGQRSLLDHDVAAQPTVEDVLAKSADQDVVAETAVELVVAGAADQHVVAIVAVGGELNGGGRQAGCLDHVVAVAG